jgi:hypothetical protein
MDDAAIDLDSLRREALRAMARVLRAPDAKPDTLLRAAEAIMRAEPIASTQGARTAALSDQDLLLIAKGVHPPKMGPMVPSAGSVPSDAPTVDPPGLVVPRETPSSDAVKAAFLSAAAETAAERPKGTQKGPAASSPPGGPTSISQIAKRGPKTDPPIATPAPRLASQIKIDDTPSPWE